MKYSEYLKFIATKGFELTEDILHHSTGKNIYLCPMINLLNDRGYGERKHYLRLKKTIKRKMKESFTLSQALKKQIERVGHKQARVDWLLRLSEINRKKGN